MRRITLPKHPGIDEDVSALLESELFDQAVQALLALERRRQLLPAELVMMGRAIQLGTGAGSLPLEEAEKRFLKALELDGGFAPALLELGWYYHAVHDDSEKGLPYFERALEITRDPFAQSLAGKAACLAETKSRAEARRFLHSATKILEESVLRWQNPLGELARPPVSG